MAWQPGWASTVPEQDVPWRNSTAAVAPAVGSIPAGLPPKLMVGLFEETGKTWMKDSGVPWHVRYRYFVKGWANNFGYGQHDGSWGLQYMKECDLQGYLPAIQYYQLNGEPGGGEAQFLVKAQNTATMKSYFEDFKLLMQRAKDFGKPVLILMEADGFALMEHQSQDNPNAYAAVAATGLPELAGLPNTVAGWGLAFLQLRKAVGANNALLGLHISAWASGKDIAHFSLTDPLEPEVAKVHTFLKPLGLAPNVTGAMWDVLVADPLDRDAEFYQRASGQDRWWDPSDTAPITSKSFNRYAEWLRLWNVASQKRWVLWQIPLGNSNHLNVDNTGDTPRAGYQDNRAEYFFGAGDTAHLAKFASSGVIALLFGRGEGRQSSYTNDLYTDGQLFMKSRAAAFLQAGGLPLPSDDPETGPPPTDTAPFHFEDGLQNWVMWGEMLKGVSSSTEQAWAGTHSLAAQLVSTGSGGLVKVSVGNVSVPAGKTLSFRVWFPPNSRVSGLQPFIIQGAGGGWKYTGAWVSTEPMTAGSWNTLTLQVPANAVSPLAELGLEIFTNGAWSGTVYLDSVSW
ncbi:hypothetical protein STIAU_2151 [Stigmatella aurantiaca DW4/3-1]|uniref:Uncharacterized protein n=1 Tax=Stigmatella aurantiaca (strain DW4/3-1) TaxID=378806 RepID=Q08TF8_STIAD|nr:hypothetical protein STIAU_2151 [Stigmatella aurantiaca DW4/3-1]